MALSILNTMFENFPQSKVLKEMVFKKLTSFPDVLQIPVKKEICTLANLSIGDSLKSRVKTIDFNNNVKAKSQMKYVELKKFDYVNFDNETGLISIDTKSIPKQLPESIYDEGNNKFETTNITMISTGLMFSLPNLVAVIVDPINANMPPLMFDGSDNGLLYVYHRGDDIPETLQYQLYILKCVKFDGKFSINGIPIMAKQNEMDDKKRIVNNIKGCDNEDLKKLNIDPLLKTHLIIGMRKRHVASEPWCSMGIYVKNQTNNNFTTVSDCIGEGSKLKDYFCYIYFTNLISCTFTATTEPLEFNKKQSKSLLGLNGSCGIFFQNSGQDYKLVKLIRDELKDEEKLNNIVDNLEFLIKRKDLTDPLELARCILILSLNHHIGASQKLRSFIMKNLELSFSMIYEFLVKEQNETKTKMTSVLTRCKTHTRKLYELFEAPIEGAPNDDIVNERDTLVYFLNRLENDDLKNKVLQVYDDQSNDEPACKKIKL